jgi:signal transduction histidine kinase
MKKVAIIFIVAVIIPSGALAWLAVRSLHDEQLLLRARQSQLAQTVADSFSKQAVNKIDEHQREFATLTEAMLSTASVSEIANTFDERIRKVWPLADVGFALKLDGAVLSPNMLGRTEGRRFRVDNDVFLCSKESVEVFVSTAKGSMNLRWLDEATGNDDKTDTNRLAALKKARIVEPADAPTKDSSSKIASAETDFRKIVANQNQGTVARFLQNKLHTMVWYRSSRDYNTVFGAQFDLKKLAGALRALINELDPALRSEFCVAILDDSAVPVARSNEIFSADWRHPAAATEIGEALPHWEVAVYPLAPIDYERAADRTRWTIGFLVAALVAAIAMGSLLLLTDLRRQLALARQKSDFVSNVSHELKTPLTSIRMFSELLSEERVADPEKKKAYLNIITAEAARLTRLINNILNFARMEKGDERYRIERCDLAKITREALANYRPQFEAHGFSITENIPETPIGLDADCDAIAQIILNLLSNAEKYSADRKEVSIELRAHNNAAEIRVLDRGLGVPPGCEKKIFQQFFRAHDSLNSGIQGSGLGLTLARQIARAHGGDVTYEPRPDGGSIFTLKLPMT